MAHGGKVQNQCLVYYKFNRNSRRREFYLKDRLELENYRKAQQFENSDDWAKLSENLEPSKPRNQMLLENDQNNNFMKAVRPVDTDKEKAKALKKQKKKERREKRRQDEQQKEAEAAAVHGHPQLRNAESGNAAVGTV